MNAREPKRIGLLIGREWSWPSAFIAEVNKQSEKVVAEFVKIGGTFLDTPCPYSVIIDRMSHEIPYYQTYVKYAALNGCYAINNPFVASADDKFFGVSLSDRLGMRTPRTVALPNKRVETENIPETFRNLEYPMDWQAIIDYVGVPAILKDVHTGGRRMAQRVSSVDELIRRYDESDTLTVVLQEIVEADVHVHCFVVGRESVLTTRFLLEEDRYHPVAPDLDTRMRSEMEKTALLVSQAYGYDINMVEYVIGGGEPVLVNPANPVPDLDISMLTADHFAWSVGEVARFASRMAVAPQRQYSAFDWRAILDGDVAT